MIMAGMIILSSFIGKITSLVGRLSMLILVSLALLIIKNTFLAEYSDAIYAHLGIVIDEKSHFRFVISYVLLWSECSLGKTDACPGLLYSRRRARKINEQ